MRKQEHPVTTEVPIMYAWFSKKQAELAGIAVYEASDGSMVECTEVTGTKEYTSSWDDAEYRGEVQRYVTRRTNVKYLPPKDVYWTPDF